MFGWLQDLIDGISSAISEADKEMLEGILPYPSDSMIEFSMPYLSGFVAKKRNIERAQLTDEVRGRMNDYAETLLRNTVYCYTTVSVQDKGVRVMKSHWEYTLMPIWLLTYLKNGKTYTFAMNGHTGKIWGKLPISIPKLAILFGSVFAGLVSLLTVIGGFA